MSVEATNKSPIASDLGYIEDPSILSNTQKKDFFVEDEGFYEDAGAGNFIIQTFNICKRMDDKTEQYIKSASDEEKEVLARWKAFNMARKEKQEQISGMHMRAAYISSFLLALNVASIVAGAACGVKAGSLGEHPVNPGLKASWDEAGKVLNGFGSAMSGSGQQIANSYNESKKSLVESLIGTDSEKAQELWEMTKREKEARKEDMKQIQQKAKQATEDAIQKTAMVYNVGR